LVFIEIPISVSTAKWIQERRVKFRIQIGIYEDSCSPAAAAVPRKYNLTKSQGAAHIGQGQGQGTTFGHSDNRLMIVLEN
jgi:hypothetical protein